MKVLIVFRIIWMRRRCDHFLAFFKNVIGNLCANSDLDNLHSLGMCTFKNVINPSLASSVEILSYTVLGNLGWLICLGEKQL